MIIRLTVNRGLPIWVAPDAIALIETITFNTGEMLILHDSYYSVNDCPYKAVITLKNGEVRHVVEDVEQVTNLIAVVFGRTWSR